MKMGSKNDSFATQKKQRTNTETASLRETLTNDEQEQKSHQDTKSRLKNGWKLFKSCFSKRVHTDYPERGTWSNRVDFVMSCLGSAVGLGNIWRFPRMVYKYGGGSFLIAYTLTLVILAFPVFFLELSIGQFTSQGPVILFRKLMPAAEGLGWCTLAAQSVSAIYYSGLMSWAVFYLFTSMTSPMPWQTCESSWNTPDCVAVPEWYSCEGFGDSKKNHTYFYHRKCYDNSNISKILEDADSCLRNMTMIGMINETLERIWKNEPYCRVDLILKFKQGDMPEFFASVIPEWLLITKVSNKKSPTKPNYFVTNSRKFDEKISNAVSSTAQPAVDRGSVSTSASTPDSSESSTAIRATKPNSSQSAPAASISKFSVTQVKRRIRNARYSDYLNTEDVTLSEISVFTVSKNNFKNAKQLTVDVYNQTQFYQDKLKHSTFLHLNLANETSWYNYVRNYTNYGLARLMHLYCKHINETELLSCIRKTLNQFDNKSEYASNQFFKDSLIHDSASFANLRGVKWQLGLSLVLTWIIVALCLLRGPKLMGKIVYFTVMFPLVIIVIFLIYTAFLDGAQEGYGYYLDPKWEMLLDADMWHAAAGQIFFSLSMGAGGLMTLSSYNQFNNNILVDAIIVAFCNGMTSFVAGFSTFAILGYMAKTLGKDITQVVPGGSASLAFVGYAHATSMMPVSNFWAILFFFMLILLAIDSEFVLVETINTFVLDEFPGLRHHRYLTVMSISFVFMLLAIPNVSRYGSGFVTIIDAALNDYLILMVALAEVIVLAYVYDVRRLIGDINMMLGKKNSEKTLFNRYSKWYFIVTWLVCPFLIACLMIFTWQKYAENKGMGNYLEIPANRLGPTVYLIFYLVAIGVFLIVAPGFFIYNKFIKLYTWREMFKPLPTWGPINDVNRTGIYEPVNWELKPFVNFDLKKKNDVKHTADLMN